MSDMWFTPVLLQKAYFQWYCDIQVYFCPGHIAKIVSVRRSACYFLSISWSFGICSFLPTITWLHTSIKKWLQNIILAESVLWSRVWIFLVICHNWLLFIVSLIYSIIIIGQDENINYLRNFESYLVNKCKVWHETVIFMDGWKWNISVT